MDTSILFLKNGYGNANFSAKNYIARNLLKIFQQTFQGNGKIHKCRIVFQEDY